MRTELRLLLATCLSSLLILSVVWVKAGGGQRAVELEESQGLRQQTNSEWHVLSPGDVSSVPSSKFPKHAWKGSKQNSMNVFFGIQHFPGHGLATSGQIQPLQPSQKLAQRAKLSARAVRLQQLKQKTGKVYDKNTGYLNAGDYASYLQKTSVAGQKAYMKHWHAKNLAAAKEAMKGAKKLYSKWMLVNPQTGHSDPNLKIPGDQYWAARGGRPVMRTQKLMEVTADNGKKYTLPWWCVGVHPEANGQGVGWEGAVTPKGPHGPGMDCTPPFQMAQQGRLQQLAEEEEEKPEEKEDEELGDEIIELPQGDGDVQIPAEELVPTVFAGRGPFP